MTTVFRQHVNLHKERAIGCAFCTEAAIADDAIDAAMQRAELRQEAEADAMRRFDEIERQNEKWNNGE